MPSCTEIYLEREPTKESWLPAKNTYRVQVLTFPEEEGGYSTIALNLPGAGSSGETKTDSLASAKEAIKAILESYLDAGKAIPWTEVTADQIEDGGELKVIFVHV